MTIIPRSPGRGGRRLASASRTGLPSMSVTIPVTLCPRPISTRTPLIVVRASRPTMSFADGANPAAVALRS
jgi:hypothetical protein